MKEHILQFAIGIDEDYIIQLVEKKAVETATMGVMDAVKAKTQVTNRWEQSYLESMIDEQVNKVIDDNRETIINRAADRLAERLSRTKAAKAMLNEIIENQSETDAKE